ncbi:hypothetical protein [Marinoscillum sp. MHG1-6]|uniref:hypothetical protein n=1 Tax=Marinoscillum sp. MHG1-6 TaxID=2959627 RepID=UPI0021571CD5|nr:hypothetical protein [Marinoscillum sp. MHG1-6]
MRKDINFPKIEDVLVAIVKDDEGWKVYLLNRGDNKLETVMVTSKGYGKKEGKDQKTSTLRHMIPYLEPGMYALIEPIDDQVFHLNNEYWVSFFIDGQLFDKKYIFVPDSIVTDNLSFIPELKLEGVLHE